MNSHLQQRIHPLKHNNIILKQTNFGFKFYETNWKEVLLHPFNKVLDEWHKKTPVSTYGGFQ